MPGAHVRDNHQCFSPSLSPSLSLSLKINKENLKNVKKYDFLIADTVTDAPHFPFFCPLLPSPGPPSLGLYHTVFCVHGSCIYVLWLIPSPSFIQSPPYCQPKVPGSHLWMLGKLSTEKCCSVEFAVKLPSKVQRKLPSGGGVVQQNSLVGRGTPGCRMYCRIFVHDWSRQRKAH